MKKRYFALIASIFYLYSLYAQVLQPVPQQPQQIAVQPGVKNTVTESEMVGTQTASVATQALQQFMPFIDPGSETIKWNGITWNINNQRLFRARFEKFLNAPEQDFEEEKEYREIMDKIIRILRMRRSSKKLFNAAFQLLPRASNYTIDARLCDSLVNAVYNAWLAQDKQLELKAANLALEREINRIKQEEIRLSRVHKTNAHRSKKYVAPNNLTKDMLLTHATTRRIEIKAISELNKGKRELSKLKSKLDFQTLLLQFFMQRRFQHVVIGTSFYRHVFNDGENSLDVEGDAKDMFKESIGMPPTLGTLESMAKEAMSDVREGVEAFNYLLEHDELESATKRLAETFFLGEYMPEIRAIPREKKRVSLVFVQKFFKLVNALEVKDYTLAEEIINDLKVTAKDFDSSKPLGAIETAKVISNMHLFQAKNAALQGDEETFKNELTKATQLWPRNPTINDVGGKIFASGDVQQQALIDLDRLVAQKNYRQIFDDKARFLAATALYPERQETLKDVLGNMQEIETAIIRAQEMAKRKLYASAWEAVEKAYLKFSNDNKLNQTRADMTTRASNFVLALRRAERLETEEETGSSLAWYLKAQNLYPESEFAREGIHRLAHEIMPDGVNLTSDSDQEHQQNE